MAHLWLRFALAPLRVLVSFLLTGFLLASALIATGLLLHRPTTASARAAPIVASPVIPPDFTPVASPPPPFARLSLATTTAPPVTAPVPPTSTVTITATVLLTDVPSSTVRVLPTITLAPLPIETILDQEGQTSELMAQELVTVLLLGKDARPDELGPSRTDTLMVAVLNLESASVTLISIPRDLWVTIPGYGQGRINTAHFLGEMWGEGPEVARQTVSQVLGIPISYTVVIDFDGFRRLIDAIGGIDLDVPEPINDPLFPDDFYGTYHLVIPAGPQHMDGELALAYARTRHGSSDLQRAARQQAVMEAVRAKLLRPEHLPNLPSYLRLGASEVETTLSLPDLFFLTRFGSTIERERIFNHVLEPPLLWNGITADGQQVLLYDPYTLQQAVQGWLREAMMDEE